MMNVALCDDEVRVLQDIGQKIQKSFAEANCPTELFQTSDPFALLEHLKKNETDVLFLDIDMPRLNGMDIAQALVDEESRTLLIFVTSHDALVYQSFQYHPFGFIRKGHFDEEIAAVIKGVTEELRRKDEFFTFRTGDGFFRVPISEILYCESESNYINLYCTTQSFRFRGTISSLEQQLGVSGFIRIHKGFLVNQCHIFALCGEKLRLDSGDLLPIGRTNRESVKRAMMRCLR